MKKITPVFRFHLLFFVILLCAALVTPTEASVDVNFCEYMPLNVGSTRTLVDEFGNLHQYQDELIGTETINGELTYLVRSTDPDGTVYWNVTCASGAVKLVAENGVVLDPPVIFNGVDSANESGRYVCDFVPVVTTPAGDFHDVIRVTVYEKVRGIEVLEHLNYYAKGVGLVKEVNYFANDPINPGSYEYTALLQSYYLADASGAVGMPVDPGPWPTFMHDTRHTGQSPYAGPKTNNLKWRYELPGGVVNASPVIGHDGTVYIGNSSLLFAINADSTLKWIHDFHGGGTGDCAPALASDGTIYIPSGSMSFYALNPNGTLKWRYDSSSGFNYSSPTIGADGTVYVGSGVDLLAIRPDGNLLWKYRVGEDVQSSPAIAQDGTIYVRGRTDYFIALNADGSEKWRLKLGSGESHTYASPAIGPDGTIYTFGLLENGAAGLYAINPDGSLKWKFSDIGFSVGLTPAVALDGTIYLAGKVFDVWSLTVFYAISPSGILQWTYKLPEGYFSNSSPAIDANGVIYFGTWGNHLYALNPNGILKWEFEALNNIDSSPAIGPDGTIYFGSCDGYLYALGKEQTFADVVTTHWAFDYIEAIKEAGITTGYGDGTYGPEDPVSREQMAVFIIRALYGETFSYSSTPYFIDVPSTHWAFKYIQKLKELGITTGCGYDQYCPSEVVTRDQMAAFLIRATVGETFSYDQNPYFTDVPSNHWAFDYIQKLKELGITTGCGSGSYCPYDMVTRDQMAAFLTRAFLR